MRDVTALRDAQTQLIEANRKLEALSITDSLTGLANRRQFDQVLLHEWSRAKLTVLDTAALWAQAIAAIHRGGSIVELLEI